MKDNAPHELQEKFNEAKTAKGVACVVKEYVASQVFGCEKDDIWVRKSEESGLWEVMWEEGPYEWSISLTGGSELWAEETGCYSNSSGFDTYANPNYFIEAKNHYTVHIVRK